MRRLKIERRVRQAKNGDIDAFNSLCFLDKQGRPWRTASFQSEWHELLKKHDRLVIFAPIEHGKSEQISRAWVLRQFGRNRNLCGAIVSNTSRQAEKYLAEVSEDIQTNEMYGRICGNVRPEMRKGRNQQWTSRGIVIERDITMKDPSLEVLGLHGAILGARLDFVVLDDPCDFENTLTYQQRRKAVDWITSTLLGRLTEHAKMVCIQTTWHEDDIGHMLVKEHGFHQVVYRAVKEDGEPLWPEQWPKERLAARKQELGSIEYQRQMMNNPLSDAMSIFKRAWFEKCLENGKEHELVESYKGTGWELVTGVDLATRKGEEHDLTVFFTVGQSNGKKRIFNITSDRMEFPEIVSTFHSLHRSFPNTRFIVENNAAQEYILQHLKQTSNIRVRGFTTGKQKADPNIGVRGMGVDFENGKWIIPNHPETMAWIQEFLSWTPQGHTGDRVMASWFADSEFQKQTTTEFYV